MSRSDYQLNKVVEILGRCLHDAVVFSRDTPNNSLVESAAFEEKDKSRWAIVAAGLSSEDANRHFSKSRNQADNARIPLQIAGGGQGSVLLQMRPTERPSALADPARVIAPYAPGDGIPVVEIRHGRIDFTFDPHSSGLGVFNLRWEIDPRGASKPPLESWLKDWQKSIGYNPSHPISHLHFNSEPKQWGAARSDDDGNDPENDLRLAIGNANPVALILSYATWVRRNLKVR